MMTNASISSPAADDYQRRCYEKMVQIFEEGGNLDHLPNDDDEEEELDELDVSNTFADALNLTNATKNKMMELSVQKGMSLSSPVLIETSTRTARTTTTKQRLSSSSSALVLETEFESDEDEITPSVSPEPQAMSPETNAKYAALLAESVKLSEAIAAEQSGQCSSMLQAYNLMKAKSKPSISIVRAPPRPPRLSVVHDAAGDQSVPPSSRLSNALAVATAIVDEADI